jgi:serine/threonine protein kinase
MGEVYLAEDSLLNRKIAIKILPAQFTTDAARLRRFEQEAKAASALNHPNIITIHEIGEARGLRFIATEFIDGQTLRERLLAGKLPLKAALDIARQIAEALAAAHEARIIHRDIKPENIMLRRDGYVKVLDFGLAKLTEEREGKWESGRMGDEDRSLPLSRSGALMGAVNYMSPEQARGADVDQRSDLFSLGVVLYEMLAGKAPFAGESPAEVRAAIFNQEPPPLAPAETPKELQRIVNRALSKDPERRYQSASEMLGDLRRFQREGSATRDLKGSSIAKCGSWLQRLPSWRWAFRLASGAFSNRATGHRLRTARSA